MLMVIHQSESTSVSLLDQHAYDGLLAYVETMVLFYAAGGESFHVKMFDMLILSDHFQSLRTHKKFVKFHKCRNVD